MNNEKKLVKLVIEFKDGIRKVVENLNDFYFAANDSRFLRVSIKGRSYHMFVACDCIKYLEVIE